MQDDDNRLSKWFASRPDARHVVRRNIKEHNEKMDQLRQGDHRVNHDVPRG